MSIRLIESGENLAEAAVTGRHVLRAEQLNEFLADAQKLLKTMSKGYYTCKTDGLHSFFIKPEQFGAIFKLDFEVLLNMGKEGEEPSFGAVLKYIDFMHPKGAGNNKPLYLTDLMSFDAEHKTIQNKEKYFLDIKKYILELPLYKHLEAIINLPIGESYIKEDSDDKTARVNNTKSNRKEIVKNAARRTASGIKTGAETVAVEFEKALKLIKDKYSEAVQIKMMKNVLHEFIEAVNIEGLKYNIQRVSNHPFKITVDGQKVDLICIHYVASFTTTNGNYVLGMGFAKDEDNPKALRVNKIYDFMNPKGILIDGKQAFYDMYHTVKCMFKILGLSLPKKKDKPDPLPKDYSIDVAQFRKYWQDSTSSNMKTGEVKIYRDRLIRYAICLIYKIPDSATYERKVKLAKREITQLFYDANGQIPLTVLLALDYYKENNAEFPRGQWFEVMDDFMNSYSKNYTVQSLRKVYQDNPKKWGFIISKEFWSAPITSAEFGRIINEIALRKENPFEFNLQDLMSGKESTVTGAYIFSDTSPNSDTYGKARSYSEIEQLLKAANAKTSSETVLVNKLYTNSSADEIKSALMALKTNDVEKILRFVADAVRNNANVLASLPDKEKAGLIQALQLFVLNKK